MLIKDINGCFSQRIVNVIKMLYCFILKKKCWIQFMLPISVIDWKLLKENKNKIAKHYYNL